MAKTFTWTDAPSSDDLAKASQFLELLGVREIRPHPAGLVRYPAKDVLRAMGLYGAPLPRDNAGVAKWLKRMATGEQIPAIVLIRGDLSLQRPLLCPEGFHRVCAAWHRAEDTEVCGFFVG